MVVADGLLLRPIAIKRSADDLADPEIGALGEPFRALDCHLKQRICRAFRSNARFFNGLDQNLHDESPSPKLWIGLLFAGILGEVVRRKRCTQKDQRRSIASAMATVRRAISAWSRSTMRPSMATAPRLAFSGRSNRAMIARARSTSSAAGAKIALAGPTWFGWMSVLPSKPRSRACSHSARKPS